MKAVREWAGWLPVNAIAALIVAADHVHRARQRRHANKGEA